MRYWNFRERVGSYAARVRNDAIGEIRLRRVIVHQLSRRCFCFSIQSRISLWINGMRLPRRFYHYWISMQDKAHSWLLIYTSEWQVFGESIIYRDVYQVGAGTWEAMIQQVRENAGSGKAKKRMCLILKLSWVARTESIKNRWVCIISKKE